MLVVVWRGQGSEAEIAFIAAHAPEWAHEKDGVQNVLPKSFSSGFVVLEAGAAWTDVRLTEDGHGPLPVLTGPSSLHPERRKEQ